MVTPQTLLSPNIFLPQLSLVGEVRHLLFSIHKSYYEISEQPLLIKEISNMVSPWCPLVLDWGGALYKYFTIMFIFIFIIIQERKRKEAEAKADADRKKKREEEEVRLFNRSWSRF